MKITIMKNVLDRNQNKAESNRTWLREKNITMINLISAPGSGKTSLLEKTFAASWITARWAVIEGDVATDHDARRLAVFNSPVIQINTEGGCHLDSHSIDRALRQLDLDNLDFIFVENVGNLVCPASFDLGENHKIALVSVPEGDDKPVKYPLLFREASVIILNKTDLIPYTNFRIDRFREYIRQLNGAVPLFEISCANGAGLSGWLDWLNILKTERHP